MLKSHRFDDNHQCSVSNWNFVPIVIDLLKSSMSFDMFSKISLICVGLAALVALEWSFPRVRPHVLLQIWGLSESEVAQVTLVWLLSCVLKHYVNFQFTSCNARILAACASVWLFARVPLLVPLNVALLCCFIFTLIAIVQFFSSVRPDVGFEGGSMAVWKVTLTAII